MEKLIDLGFEDAASVSFRDPPGHTAVAINIRKYESAKNILYAIIFHSVETEDDIPILSEVAYIGHTRKTFRNRMNGYQSGCGTAVNHRVNEGMKSHLEHGGTVEVMVLPDRHGLFMEEIHMDVAAGLEYSLIDYYCRFNRDHGHRALFNIAGNTSLRDAGERAQQGDVDGGQQELQEENADYPELPLDQNAQIQAQGANEDCRALPCSFTFQLTERTYWPKPVFNVPVGCEHHFGPHGDVVHVELTGPNQSILTVPVDRNANQFTHAPRIYFGGSNKSVYQDWKQASHVVGDLVTVEVFGRNRIRLA